MSGSGRFGRRFLGVFLACCCWVLFSLAKSSVEEEEREGGREGRGGEDFEPYLLGALHSILPSGFHSYIGVCRLPI